MKLILGIDPGTHTGIALWDAETQLFVNVEEMQVHRALETVANLIKSRPGLPVIFEDARQRQWFGNTGREVLQGAGAAKRDATIWEHFLEDQGVPYIARKPSSGSTKWTTDQFKRLTKWEQRTNEHCRDAGVLVYGFKVHEIESVVRSWGLARANTSTRTQTRR